MSCALRNLKAPEAGVHLLFRNARQTEKQIAGRAGCSTIQKADGCNELSKVFLDINKVVVVQ